MELPPAGPGIAGVSFDQRKVWNGNWSSQWEGEDHRLAAVTPDFDFSLTLHPVKAPIIQGVDGVSQKAEGRGKASYYVSFPRLAVTGSISVGAKKHQVAGTAWMDHEWFTHQLEADQACWDWFSIQLENNTELMLFELRRKDGSIDPHSSGTFVDANGKARHLTVSDFTLEPLDRRRGYPIRWRIRSVLWAGALYIVTAPLWVLLLVPGWIAWALISLWFLYRIVRGWMNLANHRPMPQ